MSNLELLSCPFCQSTAVVLLRQGVEEYKVMCENCKASSGYSRLPEQAVAAWNNIYERVPANPTRYFTATMSNRDSPIFFTTTDPNLIFDYDEDGNPFYMGEAISNLSEWDRDTYYDMYGYESL